jgi:hypothetical protein
MAHPANARCAFDWSLMDLNKNPQGGEKPRSAWDRVVHSGRFLPHEMPISDFDASCLHSAEGFVFTCSPFMGDNQTRICRMRLKDHLTLVEFLANVAIADEAEAVVE